MLSYTRNPSTIPPLGLLVPAEQTVLINQDFTLASLGTVPEGFEVARVPATEAYLYTNSGWENGINGGPADATATLSGEFMLRNPYGQDIGITW